ncbi:GNAT family N-acetyltransferase [Streptomyces sp. URMC 129]|uniref:GNAT family N-acetyltransferase n=1 Tax=Streptomyces sp. URMC 129 TaxID=3423407 RepID=UPI003F1BB910
MGWTVTGDLDDFVGAAGDFLRALPEEHSVMLTITDMLRRRGPRFYGDAAPRFGWWRDGTGPVRSALLHTPPRMAQVGALPPEAAGSLAGLLAGSPPAGAELPRAAVHAFATAWRARTGRDAPVAYETRLYRLGTLTPPDPPPPGRARSGTRADRDLLAAWTDAFHHEQGMSGPDSGAIVDERLAHDGYTLWESPDGRPVSFACTTRPAATGIRVANVYTPPGHRRRGYAGAVTAAASRRALDAGTERVLINTDLAHPTSNLSTGGSASAPPWTGSPCAWPGDRQGTKGAATR